MTKRSSIQNKNRIYSSGVNALLHKSNSDSYQSRYNLIPLVSLRGIRANQLNKTSLSMSTWEQSYKLSISTWTQSHKLSMSTWTQCHKYQCQHGHDLINYQCQHPLGGILLAINVNTDNTN